MAYAILRDGAWVEVAGAFADAQDVQRPANWLALSTPAERAAAGVVEIVEEPKPPLSELWKYATARTELIDVDGSPTRRVVLEMHTAERAAEIMWERAKAYRDNALYFSVLPVPNVVPSKVIYVERDAKSREKVAGLAQGATWAMMNASPLSVTFTDGAQPVNQQFTVDAQQIIAIQTAVLTYDAVCHGISQGIRATINTALANGASAEDIFSIDVMAGYP